MYELRPYQTKAVAAILNEWKEHQKTLLVLPTGTGKTVVFAKVVEIKTGEGKRVLILAHRNELLEQANDKLKETCGLDAVLEKAEFTTVGLDEPVTVGSVQTLYRESRLSKFPKDYFDIIIVDEAHHVMSETYQKILNYFDKALVLGVTATPDRADHKNLGQFFESLAFEYPIRQAIQEGYLSPIRAQMIPLELDINNVGISNGDYAVGEIGTALEPYLDQIAREMVNYCKDRKTIVFLPLIKTAQKFCELLNNYGFNACEVNGDSPDRDEVLKDFDEGKYNVLCNAMLLTEGWDCPSVDCVIVLRPTKIRSLYQQMVGRGMRICEGKNELLLLDFLWMTERHDLCHPSVLIAKSEDVAKRMDEKVNSNKEGVDLLDSEDEAEKDIVREREESLAKELAEMRKRQRRLVDPIVYAVSIEAEDLVNYQPVFAWEMGPASEKQLALLEKWGIASDEVKNAGLASLLISRLTSRHDLGLATPKQIKCLEKYGFIHVGTWSFNAATKVIDRLAARGWRLPYGFKPENYVPKEETN